MKRVVAFLSLFTSLSTIVCCALPALFVVLGFGAAFAGLTSAFPQLIWVSEHKVWFFSFGAIFLILGGLLQWKNRQLSCPIDDLGAACATTRDWSGWIYFSSLALYVIGAFFSYAAPRLFE
jgi:hypothetical protein